MAPLPKLKAKWNEDKKYYVKRREKVQYQATEIKRLYEKPFVQINAWAWLLIIILNFLKGATNYNQVEGWESCKCLLWENEGQREGDVKLCGETVEN